MVFFHFLLFQSNVHFTSPLEDEISGKAQTAIPTHRIGNIAFGCYGSNEMRYAKELVPRIPDDSLTVFDSGLPVRAYPAWLQSPLSDSRQGQYLLESHCRQRRRCNPAHAYLAPGAQGKLPALLQRLRKRLISAIVEKRRGVNAPVSSSLALNAIPFVTLKRP